MRRLYGVIVTCAFIACIEVRRAEAQRPVITSFQQNGLLTWTNLPNTDALYRVEWSSSLQSSWQSSFQMLGGVEFRNLAGWTNSIFTCAVPMFYRVVMTTNRPPKGMVLIPGGVFRMGDAFAEDDDHFFLNDELPVHEVTVDSFWMGKKEVTLRTWQSVRNWAITNGYDLGDWITGKAVDHPVHYVQWYEAVKFCNARSEMERRTPCYYTDTAQTSVYRTGSVAVATSAVKWNADGYRLPTEAEWEFAARGGLTGQRFPWGNTISHSMANYQSSDVFPYDASPTRGTHPDYSDGQIPFTAPVCEFSANGFGLYDMCGNVSEWCWDWYATNYYAQSESHNPRGPDSGTRRVERGSGWSSDGCRVSSRVGGFPNGAGDSSGFRLVVSCGGE